VYGPPGPVATPIRPALADPNHGGTSARSATPGGSVLPSTSSHVYVPFPPEAVS